MPGVLYVVATPIGNLGDVTVRAVEVLRGVDVVASEDTRRTRILLTHLGIRKPQVSYYDAVEREKAPALVARMVAGESVALVSDAGTPGIADPGYHLVRAAIAAGVSVVPIPGASAVAALVSVAGLPVERFVFEGFLPAKAAARAARLAALATETRTMVFLEAARRLHAFLEDAVQAFGDRDAVVGRELTKRHEEILRGSLAGLRAAVADRDELRGEVTILVAGASGDSPAAASVDVDAELRAGLAARRPLKDLVADVAHRAGVPRNDVYRRALALRNSDAT